MTFPSVRFFDEARTETFEAVNYYNSQVKGLGEDFLSELTKTLQLIVSFPKTWPIVRPSIRRCLVKRFPYGIFYRSEEEAILIIAVAHLHRDPAYWTRRIEA